MIAHTEFEKQRGVSSVEVRDGFTQMQVSRLPSPVAEGRLVVLKAMADAAISIDFVKLTPDGFGFLVSQASGEAVESVLGRLGVDLDVRSSRSIVLVHAVNIRDEEGMIAGIVQAAIALGVEVDHIGDMHDRVLMVVPTDQAPRLAEHFQTTLMGAQSAR